MSGKFDVMRNQNESSLLNLKNLLNKNTKRYCIVNI